MEILYFPWGLRSGGCRRHGPGKRWTYDRRALNLISLSI